MIQSKPKIWCFDVFYTVLQIIPLSLFVRSEEGSIISVWTRRSGHSGRVVQMPITETVSLYKVFSLGSSDWKLYNVTLESRDWTEVVSLGSFLFIVGLLGGTNRALYCNSFQWYGVIWRETSKSVRGRVARSKWWVGAASSKWCEGKSWEAESPHSHIPLCTTTCKHNFTLPWNTQPN